MHLPVFFDHNNRLMFQSSCFVGFHMKVQRISSFYHLSSLTQRSRWCSLSVCCGWLISFASFPPPVFPWLSHCMFLCLSFFFSCLLWISLFNTLPSFAAFHLFLCRRLFFNEPLFPASLCVHLLGWVHIVLEICGEISRSSHIEANLHSHSHAPQRELHCNRGYWA